MQPFFLKRVLVFFGLLLLECVMDGRVDVATSADLASTFRECPNFARRRTCNEGGGC